LRAICAHHFLVVCYDLLLHLQHGEKSEIFHLLETCYEGKSSKSQYISQFKRLKPLRPGIDSSILKGKLLSFMGVEKVKEISEVKER